MVSVPDPRTDESKTPHASMENPLDDPERVIVPEVNSDPVVETTLYAPQNDIRFAPPLAVPVKLVNDEVHEVHAPSPVVVSHANALNQISLVCVDVDSDPVDRVVDVGELAVLTWSIVGDPVNPDHSEMLTQSALDEPRDVAIVTVVPALAPAFPRHTSTSPYVPA